jgi:hypothetical protein
MKLRVLTFVVEEEAVPTRKRAGTAGCDLLLGSVTPDQTGVVEDSQKVESTSQEVLDKVHLFSSFLRTE